MSFEWQDFLVLAHTLRATYPSATEHEAAYRTAISRAYYAAFHIARDFISTTSRISHRDLISTYKRDSRRAWIKIGEALERLRDARNSADYDKVFSGRLDRALEDALSTAEAIIRQVGDLRSM